mgnify:CR=1 FL=1
MNTYVEIHKILSVLSLAIFLIGLDCTLIRLVCKNYIEYDTYNKCMGVSYAATMLLMPIILLI